MSQNVDRLMDFRIKLALVLILVTPLCFSLPEDRQQTMQLQADSADLDQQSHQGLYLGDVQFDQGETHLRAAKAITEGNEKNQLTKATVEGSNKAQAHYWTLTAKDKPPLHAYADIIHYYPDRHLIQLIGHARVQQGNDSFAAPEISYDTERQHVVSKTDGKTRTTIIIHPGKTS